MNKSDLETQEINQKYLKALKKNKNLFAQYQSTLDKKNELEKILKEKED